MGLFDSLLGRSKPKRPQLDALFALPTAALTLETAAGFTPTGIGSVCYREAEGAPFERIEAELKQLLAGASPERVRDSYGWTWLVLSREPSDVAGLVTELHAVNSTLELEGFGPALLCSLIGFTDTAGRRLALVYLYKRGTFYPFAPVAGAQQQRDNALELQIRAVVGGDLPIEADVSRWFPVWGAPGLDTPPSLPSG
ncbi:MAG TPA: hypothetical protein VK908_13280 [Jiangellales bacterium]|nr:hypothetical protein [Jiangellales bacterium]